jgi:hypothetical protein
MALIVGEAEGARHGVFGLGLEELEELEVGLEGSDASPTPTPTPGGGSGGRVCARDRNKDPSSPILTGRSLLKK